MLSGSLPGAGVATTTTILAALWPNQHFIFDWRVHAAANALRIEAGLGATSDVEPTSVYSPTSRSTTMSWSGSGYSKLPHV